MIRAQAVLDSTAQTLHPARGIFDLSQHESLIDAAVIIISRHPLRDEELLRTLDKWALDQGKQILNQHEQRVLVRPFRVTAFVSGAGPGQNFRSQLKAK